MGGGAGAGGGGGGGGGRGSLRTGRLKSGHAAMTRHSAAIAAGKKRTPPQCRCSTGEARWTREWGLRLTRKRRAAPRVAERRGREPCLSEAAIVQRPTCVPGPDDAVPVRPRDRAAAFPRAASHVAHRQWRESAGPSFWGAGVKRIASWTSLVRAKRARQRPRRLCRCGRSYWDDWAHPRARISQPCKRRTPTLRPRRKSLTIRRLRNRIEWRTQKRVSRLVVSTHRPRVLGRTFLPVRKARRLRRAVVRIGLCAGRPSWRRSREGRGGNECRQRNVPALV